MDFSNLFSRRGPAKLSPCGEKVASIDNKKCYIYETRDLNLLQQFLCDEALSSIKWSPDSRYLLLIPKSKKYILVKETLDDFQVIKIDVTLPDCADALFTPHSNILVALSFDLGVICFSPDGNYLGQIDHVKVVNQSLANTISFSSDDKYLALVRKQDGQEFISIFIMDTLFPLFHFHASVQDIVRLQWSPTNYAIMLHSSSIYNQLQVVLPHGTEMFFYQPYTAALGIRQAVWSPQGTTLAIGSFDQVVRIVNTTTSKLVAELEHPCSVTPQANQQIFCERRTSNTSIEDTANHKISNYLQKRKKIHPHKISPSKACFIKENRTVRVKYRAISVPSPYPSFFFQHMELSATGPLLLLDQEKFCLALEEQTD
eukprot:jgi/Galph1/1982/GphlegSOOS_G660.1